jgi:hypothetical protein
MSGKGQNFRSLDYSPQAPDYQPFQIIGCHIKGILLYFLFSATVLNYCFMLQRVSTS